MSALFRNLTLFRVKPETLQNWFAAQEVYEGASFHMEPPPAAALLEECVLKPVGPLEISSRGFVPPYGRDDDRLFAAFGSVPMTAVWLTIGGEDKILPAAAVNAEWGKRIDALEAKTGRRPGARQRKSIKDEVLQDMLPKALVRPSRTDVWLDIERGLVAVDTASKRTGENAVSEIRRALGSFPALPLNAEVAPRSVLTGWLDGEPLPEGLSLGDECELRDALDGGAVVKFHNAELQSDEMAKHLEAGMQCARLALNWNDHVSFVLGEDLAIRKLRFLDGALDALENTERDNLVAELDARFVLQAGTLGPLFDVLEKALKLSKAEG